MTTSISSSRSFLASLTGILAVIWFFVAAIFGTSTKLVESVPILIGACALMLPLVPLAVFSKLRLNHFLAGLIAFSAVYFSWRSYSSLIAINAWADLSLILVAITAWFFGAVAIRGRLLSAFLLSGFGLILLANLAAAGYQYVTPGWNLFGYFHPNSDQFTGLFFHRNYFGSFSALLCCFFFAIAFWADYKKAVRLGIGLLGVAALVLVAISESRGAVMSCFAGLGVLFAASMVLRKRLRLSFGFLWGGLSAIAGFLAVVAFAWILYDTLQARSDGSGLDQAFASNGRTETLWLALKVGQDAPLIGHGARSFEYESIPRWGQSSLWQGTGNLNFVHNEFGQAFTDYGSLGFIALVALILAHLAYGVWHLLQFSGRDLVGGNRALWPAFLTAGLAMLVCACIQANFSFIWHFPILIVICSASAGAMGGACSFSEKKKLSMLLQRMALGSGSFILLGGLIFLLLKIYPSFQLRRSTEFSELNSKQRLEKILEKLPDWEAQKQLAEQARAEYRAVPIEQTELSSTLRNEAIRHYQKAFDLHPKEPGLQLALADLLSEAGEYQEAEKYFQWVIKNAESRQFWFNHHWIYGIHLYRWAGDDFKSRRHRESLTKFKKARDEFDRKRRWNDLKWRKKRQDVDKSIEYLEREVIPYLPDS